MFVRKSLAGAITAALAGSALILTALPASAVTDPDDTTFTPVASDLIGVGSDTSQHAIKLLADGYNATTPASKLATFAATGGGQITLPSGPINRPNGSGAGKALLYGAGDNTDIDFARSSSAISATEKQAGLQAFPFALDTLALAVSNSVATHAPPTIAPVDMVKIYNGTYTNWSELPGATGTGVIAPKIPQAGSGTRSFFVAQLKAANGGVDVTLAASVAEVQEHDDTLIKNDANAIAPFSKGRAALLGTTLRIEQGFSADRALYNVVRGTDLASNAVQQAFGEDGYVCSLAARSAIEAAGFKQLATPAHSGVCGAATQDPTSNFTLNEQVTTTTSLAGSSPSVGKAHLVATVSGSTSPDGTVAFYEGETLLQGNVPLVSGQATYDKTGTTPGAHTYTAFFTPTSGSAFEPSESSPVTVNVKSKTTSSIKESFPASVAKGKRASGVVTVTLAGLSAKATGSVKIKKGSKTLVTKTLSNGKATIKLPKLAKGKNTLKITWGGNSNATGSSKQFTITQK
ncbi:Ig-like domain repeat protein [Nocardioides sp.]|uniref:Ig-like domain repeat protein n=1 Tax=Nocardioides sp. TaxID=35761 RepID=UPI0031FF2A39|nr:phosphate transporter substrate-binding protein PhoT family [Nocardioides sp.]